MGNGISKRKKEKDLRLPNSGLKFSPSQLSSLNYYFSDQLANLSGEPKCAGDAYDVVERLMLRMLSGVGTLDPRFSSKFLIDLDPTKAAAKKMAPRWTEEMTIKFMELYREHPCLWDQFNESYNNKFARQNALSDIASKMNIEGFDSVEVNRKIKALRSTYHSEKSKQISSEHSGAPTEETFKSTLKWFDQMKYIMTTGAVKRKKRTPQVKSKRFMTDRDKDFDEFGKLVALHLEQLRIEDSVMAMGEINDILVQKRLLSLLGNTNDSFAVPSTSSSCMSDDLVVSPICELKSESRTPVVFENSENLTVPSTNFCCMSDDKVVSPICELTRDCGMPVNFEDQ